MIEQSVGYVAAQELHGWQILLLLAVGCLSAVFHYAIGWWFFLRRQPD